MRPPFQQRYDEGHDCQRDSVRSVLETMRRCDIVVMGIGELSGDATTVQNGYITPAQYMDLRNGGYVGDFCFNHFDINGKFEDGEFSRMTLGIRHETLKSVPHVIAVAGGLHKRDAIVGALLTGCTIYSLRIALMLALLEENRSKTSHMIVSNDRAKQRTPPTAVCACARAI
jgi:hypothetical protein